MRVGRLTAGLLTAAAVAAAAPAAAQADVWEPISGSVSAKNAEVKPERFKAFTLDESGLKAGLASSAKSRSAAASVLTLPGPDGKLQRFRVQETSLMEAGLAAKHPEIKTYGGQGLDDPTASVVADTSPLGLHAAVRSADGAWYVDPYYKDAAQDVYVSYFTRDVEEDAAEKFVEAEPVGDAKASAFTAAAVLGPEVELRTYRLALTTDPSYATYFGADNVTAAKVTLMNRVNQI